MATRLQIVTKIIKQITGEYNERYRSHLIKKFKPDFIDDCIKLCFKQLSDMVLSIDNFDGIDNCDYKVYISRLGSFSTNKKRIRYLRRNETLMFLKHKKYNPIRLRLKSLFQEDLDVFIKDGTLIFVDGEYKLNYDCSEITIKIEE